MATFTYPTTLPGLLMSDYEYTSDTNVIRTELDAGPARQRRRFTSVPTKIKASFNYSLAQMRIFENFFHFTLSDGASWFNLNVVNGSGQNLSEARFTKPYTAKAVANGQSWNVSAEIEIKAMTIL